MRINLNDRVSLVLLMINAVVGCAFLLSVVVAGCAFFSLVLTMGWMRIYQIALRLTLNQGSIIVERLNNGAMKTVILLNATE